MRDQKSHAMMLTVAFAVFAFVAFSPLGFSADAAATDSKGGFRSGFSNAISDFQAKLPAIFREPSPEDVGTKPRLKTHFGATTSYTSDADLTTKETNPAWLARVSGGLRLEMPVGDRLYTEVGYTASFGTVQGRGVSANTVSHDLSALARYKLTDATQLGLKHNIQWSQIPNSTDEMFTLSTTTAEVTHKFSDVLTGRLSDTFQWFQDELPTQPGFINQEYVDNTLSTGVDYEMTERINLLPSFGWTIRNFSNIEGKDYDQYRFILGSTYKLGPQTTLSAHGGYNYRRFSNGSDRGDHAFIYGVGVVNNISQKLSWNANYDYNIQDTFDTNFVNVEGSEATNLDNLDRNFRLIRTHRIGTGATYHLNERNTFSLFAAALFARTDAEDNVIRLTENDETSIEMGPGYSFRINKYISFDLKYIFGRRFTAEDSGSGRTSYTFHKIGGGITASI